MAVKQVHRYLRKPGYILPHYLNNHMIKDRLPKNQQPCSMSSKIMTVMKSIQYLISLYYKNQVKLENY